LVLVIPAVAASVLLACESPPTEITPPRRFVEELPGLGRTYRRHELGELLKQPHSWAPVTLGDETRRGFATTLTSDPSFSVDVPSRATLRLAIAVATLDNEHWSPVRFRVIADAGDKRDVLFTETVARRDRNRWLSREIDLGASSGSPLRLTLETRVRADGPSPSVDSEALVPLWGNPVLVSADCCGERPRIILISIDCLRADHVGAYGYERDTTPHIDAFAENATLFETAVSTAPMTLPSHTSMFTGLFPSRHDGSKWAKIASTTPYLAEVLSRAGYQTDALVTGAYLSQDYGFERGFDFYRMDYPAPAAEAVNQALELLRIGQGTDQFLFLHLIDAHWPYDPPEELLNRFVAQPSDITPLLRKIVDNEPPSSPKEVEQVVALYDSEIVSADAALGRFFETLKNMGIYDGSLILLTADHGEAFYDRGHWQHSQTLHEELIRIPLIVKWPGASPRGRVRAQVSQVDIFPTVLSAAGVTPPTSDGIDLLEFVKESAEAKKRRSVISENAWRSPVGWARKISIRTEKQKYIVTLSAPPGVEPTEDHLEQEELYDLLADPDERRNLLEGSDVDAEPFRRELANYLREARTMRASRKSETIVEDDVTLERLRTLGYIN
jgi:arylsulfatase A-like enzyme